MLARCLPANWKKNNINFYSIALTYTEKLTLNFTDKYSSYEPVSVRNIFHKFPQFP